MTPGKKNSPRGENDEASIGVHQNQQMGRTAHLAGLAVPQAPEPVIHRLWRRGHKSMWPPRLPHVRWQPLAAVVVVRSLLGRALQQPIKVVV
jgi:hypothetical protein